MFKAIFETYYFMLQKWFDGTVYVDVVSVLPSGGRFFTKYEVWAGHVIMSELIIVVGFFFCSP